MTLIFGIVEAMREAGLVVAIFYEAYGIGVAVITPEAHRHLVRWRDGTTPTDALKAVIIAAERCGLVIDQPEPDDGS